MSDEDNPVSPSWLLLQKCFFGISLSLHNESFGRAIRILFLNGSVKQWVQILLNIIWVVIRQDIEFKLYVVYHLVNIVLHISLVAHPWRGSVLIDVVLVKLFSGQYLFWFSQEWRSKLVGPLAQWSFGHIGLWFEFGFLLEHERSLSKERLLFLIGIVFGLCQWAKLMNFLCRWELFRRSSGWSKLWKLWSIWSWNHGIEIIERGTFLSRLENWLCGFYRSGSSLS